MEDQTRGFLSSVWQSARSSSSSRLPRLGVPSHLKASSFVIVHVDRVDYAYTAASAGDSQHTAPASLEDLSYNLIAFAPPFLGQALGPLDADSLSPPLCFLMCRSCQVSTMELSRQSHLVRLLWVLVGSLIAEGVWGFTTPAFLAGHKSPVQASSRARSCMRMAAEGTGPYKGPSSYPLLDSVRYPHDMKGFNLKVCATTDLLHSPHIIKVRNVREKDDVV